MLYRSVAPYCTRNLQKIPEQCIAKVADYKASIAEAPPRAMWISYAPEIMRARNHLEGGTWCLRFDVVNIYFEGNVQSPTGSVRRGRTDVVGTHGLNVEVARRSTRPSPTMQ